jgi:type IV secretion system protein VirB8
MKKDQALESYFAEANAWDADRVALRERSVRMAWRIAGVATALLAVAIVALVLLMPLKRVEPFLVRVDNTTGIVDVVPMLVGHAELPELQTRAYLFHYVTVCERFNLATAESDYEECGAFHGAARNQGWAAQWDRSNSASPLNVYKDGTTIRAQVSAISFFKRASGVTDLAQVRYIKTRRPGGGGREEVTHWIATVQYGYGEPSKKPEIRRWNSLGFQIVHFRPEPEVLGESAALESDAAKRDPAGVAR